MYDANYDEELLRDRVNAKELCYQYNQLHPTDEQGRRSIIEKLLGKTSGSLLHRSAFLVRLRLQY